MFLFVWKQERRGVGSQGWTCVFILLMLGSVSFLIFVQSVCHVDIDVTTCRSDIHYSSCRLGPPPEGPRTSAAAESEGSQDSGPCTAMFSGMSSSDAAFARPDYFHRSLGPLPTPPSSLLPPPSSLSIPPPPPRPHTSFVLP